MPSPRERARCCRLARLRVRRFKSLRDVEIEFRHNPTLLVGPNGSGKTAVLESLLLLRDIIDYLRGRTVNPFLRWWGYRNAVTGGDETATIGLGVELDCSACPEEAPQRVEYYVELSGTGGSFTIALEETCAGGGEERRCIELRGTSRAMLKLPGGAFKKALLKLAQRTVQGGGIVNIIQERNALIALMGAEEPLDPFDYLLNKWGSRGEECFVEILKGVFERLSRFLEEANSIITELEIPEGVGLSSLLEVYVEDGRGLGSGRLLLRSARAAVRELRGADLLPREPPGPCGGLEGADRMLDAVSESVVVYVIGEMLKPILDAAMLLGAFLDGITVLRWIDYKAVRSPARLEPAERLAEDGSNLTQLLYRLGRGRLPEDVEAVLEAVLGAGRVTGYFDPTADGRIVLKLVVDGVELAPPSIPEGAFKAMAIMAAILLKPTLLAVDEFENSLHAQAQEILLGEIGRGVSNSLVATHSPIPIDALGTLDGVVLLRLEAGETRVEALRDTEELRRILRETGVTPSEAVLYGIAQGRRETRA